MNLSDKDLYSLNQPHRESLVWQKIKTLSHIVKIKSK